MGALANALRTFIPQFWRSNGVGGLTSAQDARTYQEHVADAIEQLEANGTASKWYQDRGAPAPSLGKAYDQYIDTDTGDTWAYDTALGWQRTGNLRGQDGTNGNNGINGRTPVKGIDYFDGTNGTNGTNGTDGSDGSDGRDGNRISAPAAPPAPSDGQEGDLAIVASTGDLQEKTATGWVTRGNLKGPKGDAGTGGGGSSGPTYGIATSTTPGLVKSAGAGLAGNVTVNPDGSMTAPAGGGGGGSTPVDADLSTNPGSILNAASVKAVNDGLGLKLDRANKATAADVAAGTDNTKYLTPQAYADSTQDLATFLQDVPAAVVSNITNGGNWNPDNRYTGPAIPNGLTMKVYYSYPADPALPAYKYEFWPGNKVVRLKATN